LAFSIIVCTPEHLRDPSLAIAAARAGDVGLLNLGTGQPDPGTCSALAHLARHAPADLWGARWDARDHAAGFPRLHDRRLPFLVVARLDVAKPENLEACLAWARTAAGFVIFEALDLDAAHSAQRVGFDGLILKGAESAGPTATDSSFLLLQSLEGAFERPVWVQGAWGPDTAAAVATSGAAGIVLSEELWLAREAPFSETERARLTHMDGTEPAGLHDGETSVPVGQGIAFASTLAQRYETAGQILTAFRTAAERHPEAAAASRLLAPDGPLARTHGTRYPIVQGPMTRVSDGAAFIDAVAANGALPFLALALMRENEARQAMRETKEQLGARPWGVGILGFVPPELRQEQLEVIREIRPRFAIIAGGRPAQATKLEDEGISTYLHVPSPGLLAVFLDQGARKFILEGRECGGHVGPRTSFTLWQGAIDVLRDRDEKDAENIHVLFAGGIHDARSAAMVETLAVPLARRGMKIGVLLGTSYLFTHEAVTSGAITEEYQRQAIMCRHTALLESGVGHVTRCASTAFAEEFIERKNELLASGFSSDEIRLRLELLNVGRLRVASKGLTRRAKPDLAEVDPETLRAKSELVEIDPETQRREGMYMIGALAALRSEAISMEQLHEDVSAASDRVSRVTVAPPPAKEPVAIVGMACLFPGAPDLPSFWRNVRDGVDAVGDVPERRWKHDQFFAADRRTPDRLYSRRGAFLEDLRFDPLHYMIPPSTMTQVEPAQLLSLEITRRALADAGYDRRPFDRDRTSVIIGCGSIHDLGINYVQRTLIPQLLEGVGDLDDDERARIVREVRDNLVPWTEDSFPGVLPNVIAGRIANRLDLHGANFVVDAACSSSLAALHTAVEQLRSGTSDVALAGAVDCSNNAFTFMGFAQTQALTPGDRPRPFDAAADGIVLGEGVATLVLKRLADAERDGDSIYAVIRGVGCSSDGRSTSLTAPFPKAQSLALQRAYEDAGVDPATVGLVEAHATGTARGDRSEIESLVDVLGGRDDLAPACAIGSVKSMIGHTKTTAGMAGMVKAALALKHRVLPPTINIETPNPALAADDAFYLNTETRPWIGASGDHPRRAGVSAFGFGGTNFHVVLEEYTGGYREAVTARAAPRPAELFAWSRKSRPELAAELNALRTAIAKVDTMPLDRLARAVHEEENHRPDDAPRRVRCAVVADSVPDLEAKLGLLIDALSEPGGLEERAGLYLSDGVAAEPESVCFLFPGQGAQYPGMLADLAQDAPFGPTMFEEADAMLAGLVPGRLSDRIFPRPALDRAGKKAQQEALTDTRIAQPALCVTDLFSLDVLRRFGMQPAMAAGHSFGECVALAAAGCFTWPGLLRLSAKRGLVLHDVAQRSPGGMAAVAADEAATRKTLERLKIPARIANANAPRQTIIAAAPDVLDAAIKGLTGEGLAVRRVAVGAPFHTPAMDEASDSLRESLAETPMWAPNIPVYSNVTAAPYPSDIDNVRELLTRNVTSCVRFVDQIEAMHRDGARVFVEVGPGRILTGLVSRILEDRPHHALALDQPGRPAWLALGHLLARSHALGLRLDLDPWFAGRDLGREKLDDLVASARAEAAGRETDWWVGPAGARPVTPPVLDEAVASATTNATSNTKLTPITNEHRQQTKPVAAATGRVETREMSKDKRDRLLEIHRETTSQWLELQRDQVRLNERFLRLQERLVAAELGQPQPEVDATADDRPPAPAPAPPAALSVPPAPVLPRLEPTAPAAPQPATPVHATPERTAAPAPKSNDDTPGGPPSVETFHADLLAEVSRRTGYPEEMLDADLPLESGLGIDSIKVMEIFSALKPYHAYLAGADQDDEDVLAQFVELKTLGAIREHYARRRHEILAGPPAAASAPEPIESPIPPSVPSETPVSDVRVDRLVVRSVPSDPLSDVRIDADSLRFSKDHVLLIAGDVPEYGPGLRAALGRGGYRAFQAIPGKTLRRAGEHRYEVDFNDPESLAGLSAAIRNECGVPVGGIVSLLGLAEAFRRSDLALTDAPLELATWLLNLAKTFEGEILGSVEAGGGLLVNLTSLDGRFGLSDSRPLPVAQAASLGFFKALSKEWRGVRVKNIDFDPETPEQVLLTALVAEIANWDDLLEVGINSQGRWSIDLVDEDVWTGPGEAAQQVETWANELSLGRDGVILATGGARGITAEVLRALAEETGARLVIVGRSPLTAAENEPEGLRGLAEAVDLRQALIGTRDGDTPAQIEHELAEILRDREIRRNIAAFRDAGSEVEYHAVDVRDPDALTALLDDVYDRLGRIDGVIHGAGVVEDKRLRDKTPESFARVFQTKVRPAMILARHLRPESLRFLAFFSSVSARFGNAGQADYSAANECLNKLAAHLDREWPGRVVAMNWGPWDCGLISDALRSAYRQRGIELISPSAGSRAFMDELTLRTSGAPEVVLARNARQMARAGDETRET